MIQFQLSYLKLTGIFFVQQPSTAGDVSNSESDEGETAAQEALLPEPVERWRSFSEGEQVRCMLQAVLFVYVFIPDLLLFR